MTSLRTFGVVLAGGVGARVGHSEPKQLIELAGRTILERSVEALAAHPAIDDVVVVMTPGFVDRAREITRGHPKVIAVLEGGQDAPRSDSSVRALTYIAELMDGDDAFVLLHDAARPLLPQAVISRVIEALATHDAVDVGIPSPDTIVEVTPAGTIARELRRDELRRVQTPQGFRVSLLRAAYDAALTDPAFEATDDATVVHRYLPGVPVQVVAGDPLNLKLTEPLDVLIAETLLTQAPEA